tara:strand:- start:1010 stop:1948 length:939 start_codon:yes stop_codon:yes gene_type:complete
MSGEAKSSLIEQFSQAIQSVKDRIIGYNKQVSEYKQGVNENADRLRELIERLRQCLDGLKNLKQNHDEFVRKLQSIYQNIDRERDRAIQDSDTEAQKQCNQKIETIYAQFKDLESTLGEMDTDFTNTISDQLTALGGVIDELCKEGDGLSSQISSSSQNVGNEIDRLQSKFSESVESSSSAVPSAASSTELSGRTVYINSVASDIWKSAGEPPDEYYFRADGQSFNDGTGIVESSYTHPKDYPMQGGWLSVKKLKSLSKTQPIRSLRKTTKKKTKKTKKTKKNFSKSSKHKKKKITKRSKKRGGRKRKTKKR